MSALSAPTKIRPVRLAVSVLALAAMLSLPAGMAHAQCEPPATDAAANAVNAAQTTAVQALTSCGTSAACGTMNAALDVDTAVLRGVIIEMMNVQWGVMREYLNRMWGEWDDSMKKQTAQLHGGQIDQSRQLSSSFDSSNMIETSKAVQHAEYQAKKEYQVTDEGCRYDTMAKIAANRSGLRKRVVQGLSTDFSSVGANKTGSPAARGRAELTRSRFDSYMANFCDGSAVGGRAGCPAGNPRANADILPSRTLFGNETVDMADPMTREAVNQLMFNITGYEAPDVMQPETIRSAQGKEAIRRNRENLTQMDAVSALAWSVVAERTSGTAAPDVYAMRQANGATNPSPNPSEREVREAMVEQLWNPKYYVQLTDGSNTATQKELYLRAQSLSMLYRIIEKTEKIANAYAIETANLLKKTSTGKDSPTYAAPFR